VALTVGCLAAAVVTAVVLPAGVGTWLVALGFGWQAVTYATAPLLAVLAERAQRASLLPASLSPSACHNGGGHPVSAGDRDANAASGEGSS
jgi:hypothetical protein